MRLGSLCFYKVILSIHNPFFLEINAILFNQVPLLHFGCAFTRRISTESILIS
jgi:hypothetical protein